jgi:hypothetical protein
MQARDPCDARAGERSPFAAGTCVGPNLSRRSHGARRARRPLGAGRSRRPSCRLRVYVDANARVELHEDQVIVRTGAGRRRLRHRQPLQPTPAYPCCKDFRVTAERRPRAGARRRRARARQRLHRGTHHRRSSRGAATPNELLVAWRNPGAVSPPPVASLPPPVPPIALAEPSPYDDARACQERVSARLPRAQRRDRGPGVHRGRQSRYDAGPVRDRIRGEAWARNAAESRPLSYECLVDTRAPTP